MASLCELLSLSPQVVRLVNVYLETLTVYVPFLFAVAFVSVIGVQVWLIFWGLNRFFPIRLNSSSSLDHHVTGPVVLDSSQDESSDDDANVCVCCHDNKKVCAPVPCGHRAYCIACAGKLLRSGNYVCSICNVPFSTFIRIFD